MNAQRRALGQRLSILRLDHSRSRRLQGLTEQAAADDFDPRLVRRSERGFDGRPSRHLRQRSCLPDPVEGEE